MSPNSATVWKSRATLAALSLGTFALLELIAAAVSKPAAYVIAVIGLMVVLAGLSALNR